MNTKKHWIGSIVPLALLVLAAACAPAPASVSATATPVPATSTPQDKLLGQASEIVGVWQTFSPHCTPGYMIIRSDGTYTWSCSRDGSDGLSGTYRFDGSDFVVLNDICGAEGHYQVYGEGYAPTGKALIFKVVKDDCAAEVSTLTSQKVTWDSSLP